ncbi:RING-H2 finger protein ATL18 [Linum grandiflorum]
MATMVFYTCILVPLARAKQRQSTTATSDEEDSCSICLAELADTSACRLSRCKHVFHLECIEKWVERDHFTCPLCRNFIFLP